MRRCQQAQAVVESFPAPDPGNPSWDGAVADLEEILWKLDAQHALYEVYGHAF
jgi:hypothetical protein